MKLMLAVACCATAVGDINQPMLSSSKSTKGNHCPFRCFPTKIAILSPQRAAPSPHHQMDKYLVNSARWRESCSSSSSEIANFTVNFEGPKKMGKTIT